MFWLTAVVVGGLAYRLFFLLRPLDWVVSVCTADDYYYYLNTAWHIAHGHGSTFDGGLTASNGYQPLFMTLLVIPFALGASKALVVWYGLLILSTCALGSAVLAWRIAARTGNRWLALCPAVVFSLNLYFVRATLWGFETPLAIFCLLGLADVAITRRQGWLIGLWGGLAIMARVDNVVAALPLLLVLIGQRRWRALAAAAVVALAVCLPWIVWSTARFGSPLPQSGAMKLMVGNPTGFWTGIQAFATHLPAMIAGYGLLDRVPHPVLFAAGVLVLVAVAQSPLSLRWLLLYAALLVGVYAKLTDTGITAQFLRFVTPAAAMVVVVLFSRPLRPRRWLPIAPLVLAALCVTTDLPFLHWVSGVPPLPNYPGICSREVPQILTGIVGPNDRVASFDSGALGYFAPVPVTNLDGLINAEIAQLLRERNPEAGSWSDRYRRYLARKGITILVGGTAFSWPSLFPDLATWERLHAPLTAPDAGEIVFLRVPPSASP